MGRVIGGFLIGVAILFAVVGACGSLHRPCAGLAYHHHLFFYVSSVLLFACGTILLSYEPDVLEEEDADPSDEFDEDLEDLVA